MKKLVLLLAGLAFLTPSAKAEITKVLRCQARVLTDSGVVYPLSKVEPIEGGVIVNDKVATSAAAYMVAAQLSCTSSEDSLQITLSKDGEEAQIFTPKRILDSDKKPSKRFAAIVSEDGQVVVECVVY